MQPPKVNSKLAADDLARDARKAGAPADRSADQNGSNAPAGGNDADKDGAEEIADAQDQVVGRGLTRLPPG